MQARNYLHGSVQLSRETKGKPRTHPVWVLRYRLPSGKDSRKMLGNAWLKASRPPAGFMTKTQARATAQRFLDDHACAAPEHRHTLGAACEAFVAHCAGERGLRASTVHDYRRIAARLCDRPWRQGMTWRDRPLDTFTERDLLAVRAELVAAGRNADTLNHYRRIVRGAFGTHPLSPALAWQWAAAKPESEAAPLLLPRAARCAQAAHKLGARRRDLHLAAEAGPRLSEIRGLKVPNVDFGVGVVRFEDGYTTRGGHAGNKGRRMRSVPMSDNVRAALWPYCKGRSGDALVFEDHTKSGEPICGVSLYRRFRSAAKRAGLPILRFHDLRHAFGRQAIRVFNIYEVQRMMGHRHITTTERYLHYAPNPEAAAKLSDLWTDGDGARQAIEPARRRLTIWGARGEPPPFCFVRDGDHAPETGNRSVPGLR